MMNSFWKQALPAYFFIGVMVLLVLSFNVFADTYTNWVRPEAYCGGGVCAGDLLIMGNLSVLGYYVNITVVDYDITGDVFVNGSINVSGSIFGGAAGSEGEVQFNEGGNFGADSNLYWDNTNKRLGIGTDEPGSVLTIVGGNLELDTTGSSSANPTTISMSHFTGATKYSRYEFGNNLNSMQAKTGGMFQIQSYWGVQIAGSRESGTPLGFGSTTTFDPSLNVLGRVANNVVLAVTGGSSQSADLQQWRTSAGVPLSVVDNEGKGGFGTSNPDRMLHLSSPDGNAILRLERADTAIDTGDKYGKIEWEGKDASGGAAGVRVEIDVEAYEHLGANILTFSKALASSGTLFPVMTFNQFNVVDFPYGIADLKIQSVEPWMQYNVLGSIVAAKELIRWNVHAADPSTGMTGDVGKIALIAEAEFSGQQARTAWVFYTHTGRADTNPIQEALRITNTKRLGVGDPAPNQAIGVLATNAQISLEESNTEFIRIGVEATDGDMIIGWDDSDDLHLGVFTSPTDTTVDTKMIIQSDGKVGIGTDEPSHELNILGSANITGDIYIGGTIYAGLAHISGSVTTTQDVISAGVWHNMTFNESTIDIEYLQFTNNRTVTISHDGHYIITLSAGIHDDSPSPASSNALRIALNAEELFGSYIEIDIIDRQDEDMWIEHTTHVELSEGDTLEMQYISSDIDVHIESHATYSTVPMNAYLYIQEIII